MDACYLFILIFVYITPSHVILVIMLPLLGYQLVSHVCQVTMPTKLVLFTASDAQLDTVVQMPQPRPLHALQATTVTEGTYHVRHALRAGGVQRQPLTSHYFVPRGSSLSLLQQSVWNVPQAIIVLLGTKILLCVQMVAIATILVNRNAKCVKLEEIAH